MRADELFTTGSIVEQIWDQITKAALLLADLSGKNANVFYELGLAHAARKPVVFTSSNVEDVPFDLRHLRVIIYDIREPEWATRLRKSISDYLRNAIKEPDKSIPHPFRAFVLGKMEEEEEAEEEEETPEEAIQPRTRNRRYFEDCCTPRRHPVVVMLEPRNQGRLRVTAVDLPEEAM